MKEKAIRQPSHIVDQVLGSIEESKNTILRTLGDRWGKDRANAIDYWKNDKEIYDLINAKISDITRKRQFNYLDLAGRATLSQLKNIESYTFSLDPSHRRNGTKETHFSGNVLSSNSFDTFIDNLPNKVDLVTLNSENGFNSFTPESIKMKFLNRNLDPKMDIEPILFRMVYRRLRKLRKVMNLGGFLLSSNNLGIPNFILNSKFPIEQILERAGFKIVLEKGNHYKTLLEAV